MLTVAFTDDVEPDPARLGGKGAGLVRMAALGLPVPPGFVIPCSTSGALAPELLAEVDERVAALGDGVLVSVRSGAPVSMPGMMDTVLNVGLTHERAAAMGARGEAAMERLLHGLVTTVRGVSGAMVEDAFLDLPTGAGVADRCRVLEELLGGLPAPQQQLHEAIGAVFRSWGSRRAKAYRTHKGIPEDLGTAVVVQRMVFGLGERSATGVAFTRDPATGAYGTYGDILFDAQGEDVVAGERDTLPLSALAEPLPDALIELKRIFAVLEHDARDLCDVEFTVEDGTVYVLQTRVGQRSGRAAVRLAVAFAEEGAITRKEAVARVTDEQLAAAQAPQFQAEPAADALLARGLAASPGAVSGVACVDCDDAQRRADAGEDVVLLRPTTTPQDLPGVLAARGVVTFTGGRTSHAAVVARGLDRPAVCGTGPITVEPGTLVSVDGDRGLVARGALELASADDDPILTTFLEWRDADPR